MTKLCWQKTIDEPLFVQTESEFGKYFVPPHECKIKDEAWHLCNADFLEELKAREEKRALEEEQNAKKPKKFVALPSDMLLHLISTGIMSDEEEVYLKPKYVKTPWFEKLSKCEDYEELKPEEPRKKKAKSAEGEGAAAKESKKKKKPRSERKANKSCRRHLQQMFVRGDNIVMIVILIRLH